MARTVVDTITNRILTPEEVAALPQPPVPSLQEVMAAKLSQLADTRWRYETGGISLPYQDQALPVPTDRESRGEAFIAATLASSDPNYTRKIKIQNGLFIDANAATIMAVAALIDQHVQACFDNEAALTVQILASNDPASVDITVGWPT